MVSSIEPSRERFGQGSFLIVCSLAAAAAAAAAAEVASVVSDSV